MSTTNSDIVELIPPEDYPTRWNPFMGPAAQFLPQTFMNLGVLPTIEAGNRVLYEAHRILGSCKPPDSMDSPATGLVCGRVQSGKTASMTAVSALAKDNGFRVIILIAGVTNLLVDQNSERLKDCLRSGSFGLSWHMVENPTSRKNLPELQTLIEEWGSRFYEEGDKRSLLVFVMKHAGHLDHLASLLSEVDLSQFPAIIIDDEADQASLNTRPLNPSGSPVYLSIQRLRTSLPNHSYLQYTATPQAPLLIARIDSLSADFAELVYPGDNYIGGEHYFSLRNPRVVSIPNNELFPDASPPSFPPDSLLEALRLFYLGVAVGRIHQPTGHRSMLIHPSQRKATHNLFHDWVGRIQGHWHRLLLAPEDADYTGIVEEFRLSYNNLVSTQPDIPSFDGILRRLPSAIGQTSITIVNSNNGNEIDWDNSYSHILVGGEKLARGYTVKGLTVTYMSRGAGGWTADTIQQRARFYGYHATYFGLCRLFMHPDVTVAFTSYLNHEQDMRSRLHEYQGRPLKEWPRIFYLDHHLAPTRRNVLSSPIMRPDFRNSWFSPKAPHNSKNSGRSNLSLVNNMPFADFSPDANYPQHSRATYRLSDILEHFLIPWSYIHEDDVLGLCVINCNIATAIERNPDLPCHLVRINNGSPRIRNLTDGCIPQLFQGRSSAGSQNYPGDAHFFQPDMPTIQIHILDLREGGYCLNNVPAIAIRLSNMEDTIVQA